MKRTSLFPRLLRDQSGVTLVEVLAALFIFLIILIPLTSVYVSGVQVYNQTREQTALRNAADFAIGEVMRTVQGASYFELDPVDAAEEPEAAEEMKLLLRILQTKKAGELIPAAEADKLIRALEAGEDIGRLPFSPGLALYTSQTVYAPLDEDAASPVSSGSVTQSLLTRKLYRFAPADSANELVQAFRMEPGYLIRGLFSISADNKTMSLYLVVAPEGEKIVDRDGQQMRFSHLDEIRAELERMEAHPERISSYIRVVRTEIAVANLQRRE